MATDCSVGTTSTGEWADGVPQTFGAGPSDPLVLADAPGTWAEIVIAAPAERVWVVVTDIDLPAKFSSEFGGATWTGTGPALGASFVGRNRHPAIGEWEVESFVDVFDEGRSFGWATIRADNPGSRWRFDLEPAEDAVWLRFSLSVGPGPSGISMAIESMPEKEPQILRRRVLEHHANMVRTLEGLKAAAESPR
jgi:hypothetical protein